MGWFLYDKDLRNEKVELGVAVNVAIQFVCKVNDSRYLEFNWEK